MQESRKDTSITDSSAGSRASSEGVSGVDEGVIKTAQARVETVSYAQNCEDIMLLRALGDVDSSTGFYVDVGAQDPVVDSVTKAFYERGYHARRMVSRSHRFDQDYPWARDSKINTNEYVSLRSFDINFEKMYLLRIKHGKNTVKPASYNLLPSDRIATRHCIMRKLFLDR